MEERASEQSAVEAWLGQFKSAWRPLDPQLRAVLRSIYGRLMGLPPPAQLSPEELRRINAGLSFYFGAGSSRAALYRDPNDQPPERPRPDKDV